MVAAVYQAGVEHAEGDCRDQEAQPGAGLGHEIPAGGRLDQERVGVERHSQHRQPHQAELQGEMLQVRRQERAEGHQEIQVEQRGGHRPEHPPAQHGQEQQLHEAHRHQLAAFHDAHALGRHPGRHAGDCQQAEPGQRLHPQPGQVLPPLPGEIERDRQHEPAMGIGGGIVPHLHRRHRLLVEQQAEHGQACHQYEPGIGRDPARIGRQVGGQGAGAHGVASSGMVVRAGWAAAGFSRTCGRLSIRSSSRDNVAPQA